MKKNTILILLLTLITLGCSHKFGTITDNSVVDVSNMQENTVTKGNVEGILLPSQNFHSSSRYILSSLGQKIKVLNPEVSNYVEENRNYIFTGQLDYKTARTKAENEDYTLSVEQFTSKEPVILKDTVTLNNPDVLINVSYNNTTFKIPVKNINNFKITSDNYHTTNVYQVNGYLKYDKDNQLYLDGTLESTNYKKVTGSIIRKYSVTLVPSYDALGGWMFHPTTYPIKTTNSSFNLIDILSALKKTKLKEINHIIWKYNFGVYTKNKFISSHYHILYYVKPGKKYTFNTFIRFNQDERNNNNGSLNYSDREDVWVINREYKPGKVKNKNELPKELLMKMIQYSSNEDDLICDLFLGSFSTAKVAIGLNRNVIGFEKSKIAYDYQISQMKNIKRGYLINEIKTPKKSALINQGKNWSDEDLNLLKKRYYELSLNEKKKKNIIETLMKEFGRGRFSILNKVGTFEDFEKLKLF